MKNVLCDKIVRNKSLMRLAIKKKYKKEKEVNKVIFSSIAKILKEVLTHCLEEISIFVRFAWFLLLPCYRLLLAILIEMDSKGSCCPFSSLLLLLYNHCRILNT
jgi:hypothetical protein